MVKNHLLFALAVSVISFFLFMTSYLVTGRVNQHQAKTDKILYQLMVEVAKDHSLSHNSITPRDKSISVDSDVLDLSDHRSQNLAEREMIAQTANELFHYAQDARYDPEAAEKYFDSLNEIHQNPHHSFDYFSSKLRKISQLDFDEQQSESLFKNFDVQESLYIVLRLEVDQAKKIALVESLFSSDVFRRQLGLGLSVFSELTDHLGRDSTLKLLYSLDFPNEKREILEMSISARYLPYD